MDTMEKNRIYGEAVALDTGSVKSFWDKKAAAAAVSPGGTDAEVLKSVLLGTDLAQQSGVLRNERELRILRSFTNLHGKTILDIGCGIGRWAHNVQHEALLYHGVDFSREFITKAKAVFQENPRITFFCMSAVELDLSSLLKRYDLIIITGVAMYINDAEIARLFEACEKLTPKGSALYFQESVSVMGKRLTLKNFDSKELNTRYNAIYRTPSEYEALFSRYLNNFATGRMNLLLDKETGAREETNAGYWFLIKQGE